MLTAQKSRWFEKLFAVYNRSLFWRRFSELNISGIERLRERDKNLPLVLYANHSSWWDGLVAFEIGRLARLDHFVMMDEQQLRQLFLFRGLGAFGVRRDDARGAARSLVYARELLRQKPGRALWIFPQGEILPNDARPLNFYNGAAQIIKQQKKCGAAPVAMRYEFQKDFKPAAFARIGQVETFENIGEATELTAHLARKLTDLLDDLKRENAAANSL